MRKVVERERNKGYYRILHLPIWMWVFFILPGNLTYALYLKGPGWRHGLWLILVTVICAWRGFAGRLPGVEPKPYIRHYGFDQPNLPYRVICYTAAWIDLLVPFTLNLVGLVVAAVTGQWLLADLYAYLYYPLGLIIVFGTLLDKIPRARRSTINEGAEKAWFYIAIWTVVPAQVAAWAAWRLGGQFNPLPLELNNLRLMVFLFVAATLFLLGVKGKLPRSQRNYARIPMLNN